MTDDDLIERLREIQGQAGLFASAAADRIEQLVATNEALRQAIQHANDHADAAIKDMEALVKERDDLIHDLERIKDSETEQLNRAERLEAALRVIAGNNCITCSAEAFNALFAERHPSAAHTQKEQRDWRSDTTKTEDGYNG